MLNMTSKFYLDGKASVASVKSDQFLAWVSVAFACKIPLLALDLVSLLAYLLLLNALIQVSRLRICLPRRG